VIMARKKTVGALFGAAIAFEKKAEDFYRGLAKKFSGHPAVSSFWKSMMEDEMQHSRTLQEMRDSLRPEQLKSVGDDSSAIQEDELARFSALYDLSKVNNLDEACEMARDIESSEMSTKIQSLVKKFIPSEIRVEFVISVLENHVSKLREFSESFDPERKKSISADILEQ
jgi:rubrerythrin